MWPFILLMPWLWFSNNRHDEDDNYEAKRKSDNDKYWSTYTKSAPVSRPLWALQAIELIKYDLTNPDIKWEIRKDSSWYWLDKKTDSYKNSYLIGATVNPSRMNCVAYTSFHNLEDCTTQCEDLEIRDLIMKVVNKNILSVNVKRDEAMKDKVKEIFGK